MVSKREEYGKKGEDGLVETIKILEHPAHGKVRVEKKEEEKETIMSVDKIEKEWGRL